MVKDNNEEVKIYELRPTQKAFAEAFRGNPFLSIYTLRGCIGLLEKFLEEFPEKEIGDISNHLVYMFLDEECSGLYLKALEGDNLTRELDERRYEICDRVDALMRDYVYNYVDKEVDMFKSRRDSDLLDQRRRIMEKGSEMAVRRYQASKVVRFSPGYLGVAGIDSNVGVYESFQEDL